MNKPTILFFIFLFVFLSQISFIKNFILDIGNDVKVYLVNISEKIDESYLKYVNQAYNIENLIKENKKLKNEYNLIEAKFNNCKELKYFNYISSPNLVFTKVISYVKLPDFTSLYIDYKKHTNKAQGLVYNNIAAGVVVKKVGNYSIAYLNSNKNTVYAVYIGDNKIPGVFYGKEKVIKYIPKFKKINVGDVVITSGLDNIFYEGARVGVVKKVIQKKLYQEAKIDTFFNDLNPKYFYVVELKK